MTVNTLSKPFFLETFNDAFIHGSQIFYRQHFSVIKYLNSKNAASFATQNCFNRFLDSSIIQQKCR